jgi:hypothetical protein
MLPKWLRSGIPFQGRLLDLVKFVLAMPIIAIAQVTRLGRR